MEIAAESPASTESSLAEADIHHAHEKRQGHRSPGGTPAVASLQPDSQSRRLVVLGHVSVRGRPRSVPKVSPEGCRDRTLRRRGQHLLAPVKQQDDPGLTPTIDAQY